MGNKQIALQALWMPHERPAWIANDAGHWFYELGNHRVNAWAIHRVADVEGIQVGWGDMTSEDPFHDRLTQLLKIFSGDTPVIHSHAVMKTMSIGLQQAGGR